MSKMILTQFKQVYIYDSIAIEQAFDDFHPDLILPLIAESHVD